MSRLTKAQREQVRQRFGGRCACCGDPLPQRRHAEHRGAVSRKLTIVNAPRGYRFQSGAPRRPERDVIDNDMPSRPPCNISKHAMSLEAWRSWLAGHVSSLNANHPIYRLVKRYGLVLETGAPVVFHVERVAAHASGAGACP